MGRWVEDVVTKLLGQVRWVVAVLVLTSPVTARAQSQSIDGWGRATVMGGYRWVPNWYFASKAAAAGQPYTSPLQGGPQGVLSFGYGATEWLEVSVDLFAASHAFTVDGLEPFTSFSYGAGLGARLMKTNVLFPGFTPYVGIALGPVLSDLFSSSLQVPERLLGGYLAVGGFHWKVADRWAITFDVRYLYARSVVPDIGGINVGGVFVSLGVSMFFPPAPKRDLEVPGFGSSSNLPN